MAKTYGPTLPISEEIHRTKYRGEGETFKEAMTRVANALKDDEEHFAQFREVLYEQRFLPAGRVQSAIGAPRETTPYNCFVSGTIKDDFDDIYDKLKESGQTMRLGGGIGYGFSHLRPKGALISTLDSQASGPVSFMGVFDASCATISSAGHRRGAQMGVLRVDHPDIEEFVTAKTNTHRLTNFNISVGVTDYFMKCVKDDENFPLVFEGRVHKVVKARALWDKILRATWDWAEPGILFIDRINKKNNLRYCETIEATNPCGEQPLPPYGACLLGSFNLVKYLYRDYTQDKNPWCFDWRLFAHDIPYVVRAMDNIVDVATYPLEKQAEEARNKRRMGLGVTGLANCIEALGYEYGSDKFIEYMENILVMLRDTAYKTSVSLAIEKGAFPLYDERYLDSDFAKTLPEEIRELIKSHGIRNSHLLSIAPTGTISLSADNVSSGIEPIFSRSYTRTIITADGPKEELIEDYGVRELGVAGRTADSLSVFDHVKVLTTASRYVDSAVSKTCNVGESVTWEQFKDVYMQAYDGGASGCTTFRAAGKRIGILKASKDEEVVETEEPEVIVEGAACYIDPETGIRSCE